MKLLLVIDFQNDFVTGTLGFEKAKELEERIYQKIIKYQKGNQDVVYTLDTHDINYLDTQEGRNLPIAHCQKGSKGWELYGKINKLEGYKITKGTFGAVGLFEFLKNSHYDEIELVGLVSNICVISNAIIAKTILPEAKIIVDASCTGSSNEELHNKAIDVMLGLQIEIINRGVNDAN
jgi:nicotinamidase-related amidase